MDATKDRDKKIEPDKLSGLPDLITVKKEGLLDVVNDIRDDKNKAFEHLNFITAVDYGDYFELVYQFYSYKNKRSLTVKTSVLKKEPEIDSITPITLAADWQEREVYDLFGIKFKGHPDLRRILLADDFPGHPLRKDYPNETDDEYLRKEYNREV